MHSISVAVALVLAAPLAVAGDLSSCDPAARPMTPVASGLIIEHCLAVGRVRIEYTIGFDGRTSDIVVESAEIEGGEFLTRCASEIATDTVKRLKYTPIETACRALMTITFTGD